MTRLLLRLVCTALGHTYPSVCRGQLVCTRCATTTVTKVVVRGAGVGRRQSRLRRFYCTPLPTKGWEITGLTLFGYVFGYVLGRLG